MSTCSVRTLSKNPTTFEPLKLAGLDSLRVGSRASSPSTRRWTKEPSAVMDDHQHSSLREVQLASESL